MSEVTARAMSEDPLSTLQRRSDYLKQLLDDTEAKLIIANKQAEHFSSLVDDLRERLASAENKYKQAAEAWKQLDEEKDQLKDQIAKYQQAVELLDPVGRMVPAAPKRGKR